MGAPIAKQNDTVVAVDTHIVLVPAGPAIVPTPLPHPFNGKLVGALATTVTAGGLPVALVGSTAVNQPPHMPTPPGASFQKPPTNSGRVVLGSQTVKVEGRAVARAGDTVETCNDPADAPLGKIVAAGTVFVGG